MAEIIVYLGMLMMTMVLTRVLVLAMQKACMFACAELGLRNEAF
jgi:hypothetical protein